MDWQAAGELAVWIVAIAAALGVIVRSLRSRPVRWLWRRNVGEPFSNVLRAVVREVVTEEFEARPWTNGKSWEAIEQVQTDVAELRRQLTEAPVQIEQTVKRTTRIEPDP